MIFSSFGNAPAEMSFIRMAHAIDEFAKESEEDVFVQVGNTRYEFKYARIVKFLEHEEMVDAMRRASIVVLQGGWGTISEAIFLKKTYCCDSSKSRPGMSSSTRRSCSVFGEIGLFDRLL